MYRGIATFTLDWGTCPAWLFARMVRLGRALVEVIVADFGTREFIRRLADPVWFQSLGTVLAFDWNASGLTTILTAALKEAIRGEEADLGLFICGGKGKTSRKTPDEIVSWGERLRLPEPSVGALVYNSKMSAKVDSSLVQDGYQLYHHSFFFSRDGNWAVVQQGMNTQSRTARRYHWYSGNLKDFVQEPHRGIAAQKKHPNVLNLTASQSDRTRQVSVELVSAGFKPLRRDIEILRKHSSDLSRMLSFRFRGEKYTLLELDGVEFHHHPVIWEDFWDSPYLKKILARLCGEKPEDYEKLLATGGVGPKTIRALSLVAEILYGAPPSYEDPARYSFAHGGKDATPYPVDYSTYDQTIAFFDEVVQRARLPVVEKDKLRRHLRCAYGLSISSP